MKGRRKESGSLPAHKPNLIEPRKTRSFFAPMYSSRRIQREAKTIEAMIRIYCRKLHHGGQPLCAECGELLDYARRRLQKCPFQQGKTTCGKCAVHCYKPVMREKIRKVMRYVGPRMMLHHPYLGFMHLLDGWRKKPKKRRSG